MKAFILLLLLCLSGCQKESTIHSPDTTARDSATTTRAAKPVKRPEFLIDSLTLYNKTYTVIQGYPAGSNEFPLRILYAGDTIYRHDEKAANGFEFEDFDGDGIADIRLHYLSNVPRTQLIMFDKNSGSFKAVKNFEEFFEPEKITNTKYYYSYHPNGCGGGGNWASELFYIKNYEAVAIGKIDGIGCEDEARKGIFIYRLNGEKQQLIKEITTEPGIAVDKWDFIADYWPKNYNEFE